MRSSIWRWWPDIWGSERPTAAGTGEVAVDLGGRSLSYRDEIEVADFLRNNVIFRVIAEETRIIVVWNWEVISEKVIGFRLEVLVRTIKYYQNVLIQGCCLEQWTNDSYDWRGSTIANKRCARRNSKKRWMDVFDDNHDSIVLSMLSDSIMNPLSNTTWSSGKSIKWSATILISFPRVTLTFRVAVSTSHTSEETVLDDLSVLPNLTS